LRVTDTSRVNGLLRIQLYCMSDAKREKHDKSI